MISRRNVLGAIGAGLASAPFISPLRPGVARAQGATNKRLIVFFSPNEPIEKSYWEPSGTGNDRALPTTFPRLLQSLEPHRAKLSMIGDVRMVTRDRDSFGGGHVGIGHMLTGEINLPYGTDQNDFYAGGISVDQFLANRLGVEALTLGMNTRGTNGGCRMSYRAANEPVHPIESETEAFARVFGDTTVSAPERDVGRLQRASVLDAVARRIGRTQSRLGAAQRERLDRHLTAVRTLETRLAESTAMSCTPGAPPEAGGDFPTRTRRQIDVMVEALACNTTRIATLQLGNSGGAETYAGGLSWPSEGIEYTKSQHVIAHEYYEFGDAETVAKREAIEEVYYKLFTYLLDRLDEVNEPDGTLLDNSIVLYAKNIGTGHRGSPMFYMLAGGGGAFRTGRYFSYEGVPHNNLLVTLCQLMGQTDVTSYGNADICTGDLGL